MQKNIQISAQNSKCLTAQVNRIQSAYWSGIFNEREEASQFHSRWQDEKFVLQLIYNGNVSEAEQFFRSATTDGTSLLLGDMSTSALHEARYALVAGIAMYTRTAIEAGLPEDIAYSISDSYIREIDKNNDPSEILLLMFASLQDFCQAVHDWSYHAYSPSIRICCEYIMTHLHQPISCDDLAKACHLSPNYVSDLFYEELHVRPIAYIRRQKLKQAKFLLRNTTMPIAAIANQFAFPSPSAFSVYFQKEYGVTPTEYRTTRIKR